MGSLQATEAIKLILGVGQPLLGRLLSYDALAMSFDEFRFRRRADCAVCGEQPTILSPQDPPGFCTREELRRVPSISAAHLSQRLAAADAPSLIDVREADEFALGHLPQARNVPLSRIERSAQDLPESGDVIFVCRSGVRSRKAAALARRAGSSGALQLEGGLLAWQAGVDPSLRL